ncbi:MAG: hypothetical protein Q9222_005806 [Ikaeria aurantiellina]
MNTLPLKMWIFFLISVLLTICTSKPISTPPLRNAPRIQCDSRTKRPIRPSLNNCETFLENLSILSHKEKPGTFKYYGRNIGPCAQCVQLPTIIHIGKSKCAAVIDVDDKDAKDFSVFDTHDLWQALHAVIGVCWLGKKQDGRGFPNSQTAWAGFNEGIRSETGGILRKLPGYGNETMSLVDLDEG